MLKEKQMTKKPDRKQAALQSVIVYLLGVLAFLSPFAAKAADKPLEKVRIAYSSISSNTVPVGVTYERGLFRKYGLDVQLLFIEGGSRVIQTLMSGDVAAAQVAGSAIIEANIQGAGVKMIAGFINTMPYKFMVAKEITNPEQLKGKALAVSRFGSSSDFATRYAVEKYGLTPGKDVTILQIGAEPARMAALEAGKIHGAMVSIPTNLRLQKLGFNTLADLQMLGLEYQHTAFAVPQTLINSRPDVVRNIMKAFVEGIAYFKTHRRESVAIMQKYMRTDDTAGLEEGYDSIGIDLIPEKPYPTLKGIQIMLQEMAAREPKAQGAKAEQFVDLTFIRELDKSGFIDRLYKAAPAVATGMESPIVSGKDREKPAVAEKPKLASNPSPAPQPKINPTPVSTKPVQSPSPTASKTTAAEEYTIKAGDTLSKLAQTFYGDAFKWEKLYAANRETIKNPDYIFIGQKITIPAGGKSGM